MTTPTLTKTAPSIEGELRIPAVEANLLPVEIVEARRGRLARRVVVTALVLVTILTTAWYGQARYQTSVTQETLRLTEEDAQRVQEQQQDFPDLIATRAESQAIQTRLSGLLAGDLQWSRLLFSIRVQAPDGIRVTGVVGALHDDTAATEAAAARTPDAVIGRLTVTGISGDRAALAAFVDRLGRIEGLTNPLLNSATIVEGSTQFSVQLDITTKALASRFITEDK
jgi:Tfp pilus assembly protein PilN